MRLFEIISGIFAIVASILCVLCLDMVMRLMPSRWLKAAFCAMLISTTILLAFRGLTFVSGWTAPKVTSMILVDLFSVGVIILFLCATGRLNGRH